MENVSKSNMQSVRLLPFDPIVLVQDVLKRWLVVVLAALAVGIGTYIYTDATYAPVYRTTTTFVVTTRGSSTSVYSSAKRCMTFFQRRLVSSTLLFSTEHKR